MAGNNCIQFLRGTEAQRQTHTETSLIGQPIYTTDENQLYVGNGIDAVKDLQPISGIVTTSKLDTTKYCSGIVKEVPTGSGNPTLYFSSGELLPDFEFGLIVQDSDIRNIITQCAADSGFDTSNIQYASYPIYIDNCGRFVNVRYATTGILGEGNGGYSESSWKRFAAFEENDQYYYLAFGPTSDGSYSDYMAVYSESDYQQPIYTVSEFGGSTTVNELYDIINAGPAGVTELAPKFVVLTGDNNLLYIELTSTELHNLVLLSQDYSEVGDYQIGSGFLIKLPEPYNGVYLVNTDVHHIVFFNEDDYSQPTVFEGEWSDVLEADSVYCMLNEAGDNLLVYDPLESTAAIIRLTENNTIEVVQDTTSIDWKYGTVMVADYSYSPDLYPSTSIMISNDLSFVMFEQYTTYYKYYKVTSSTYN